MKMETGRFDKEDIFDDLFAATLVVKDLNEINRIEEFLKKDFSISKKKPLTPNFTHKASSSFPFDDLRLYLKLKDYETGKLEKGIYNLTFELQIKTFLQHAWTIATHDLIYKSQDINWAKERVAYQVKAILEQAEIMISGVNELSDLPILKKQNKEVQNINKIIYIIQKHWDDIHLPNDRRRLAQNLLALVETFNLNLKDLDNMISNETKNGRGTNILNLSPYLIVIQSLIYSYPDRISSFLKKNDKRKGFKLLLTSELNTLELLTEDIILNNIVKI